MLKIFVGSEREAPKPDPQFNGILSDPAVTLISAESWVERIRREKAERERAKELAGAEVEAAVASARFRPVRSAIVKAAAKRGNVSEDVAEKALVALEADTGRPSLDFLLNGGLEGLIRLILELLPLFA